jgi:type I restriction enzyme S subunit
MKSGWKTSTLGDVFTTATGNTPPKNNAGFYGDFMPFIKPPELCDSYIDSSVDGLSKAGAAVARTLPPESILVSCIGNLGKIGLNVVPAAFNQQINAILPDRRQAIPRFMFFQVLSSRFREQLEALSSGTTVPIVNKSKFNSIEIVVPPVPEQERMVGILDEAFEGIAVAKANAEKNLQNARAIFESYLEAIFTHKEKRWVDRNLASLCSEITVGHVGPMKAEYKDGGIPFLRSQNIRPFEVSMDNAMFINDQFHRSLKKSQLRPGDLAIVRTGYPGTAAVIPSDLPDSNCSDLVIVRPGKEANPHFLAAFFNSAHGKRLVLGKIVGAAQKHFNVTAAKGVTLHVPPVTEQQVIVDRIDNFRIETQRLESTYQRRLAALDELKKSLLHQAFTGNL